MNYVKIKTHDISNGSGVRVSLFVSGCHRHCEGCFNPETWDFKAGEEFTKDTENYIFKAVEPEWIRGLSILGGEPFEELNAVNLIPFIKRFKEKFPDKDIWAYTGFTYEQLLMNPIRTELLNHIDVLVDGPFLEEFKIVDLRFRGSTNQRVIDVKKSIEEDCIYTIELVEPPAEPIGWYRYLNTQN